MANDRIRGESKTSKREIFAAVFLLAGPAMVIGGSVVVWGWGGFLLTLGLLATVLGVTMGVSRTGKG